DPILWSSWGAARFASLVPSFSLGTVPGLPADAHEWITFSDPDEDRQWRFDVTFLLSSWTCIFGAGCQGVLTGPTPEMSQGCCSYGAHFTGPEDAERVIAAAAALTPTQWQFAAKATKGVTKTTRSGQITTRLVADACIFLNRPGFAGGPGCALHRGALESDIEPLQLKPDVCWQLPLRREDADNPDGSIVSTVTQWDRQHWGGGGEEFAWWCTEAPEAFVGSSPVYISMKEELKAMCGEAVYETLATYLDTRADGAVPLPHPVRRQAGS
ncbi:MAG: hypothetical protein ACYCZM_08000, partial [Acidimicrobiales bacterium]